MVIIILRVVTEGEDHKDQTDTISTLIGRKEVKKEGSSSIIKF